MSSRPVPPNDTKPILNIQGDQLYLAVWFCYLVKRELFNVRFCTTTVLLLYTSVNLYRVPEQHDHVYFQLNQSQCSILYRVASYTWACNSGTLYIRSTKIGYSISNTNYGNARGYIVYYLLTLLIFENRYFHLDFFYYMVMIRKSDWYCLIQIRITKIRLQTVRSGSSI